MASVITPPTNRRLVRPSVQLVATRGRMPINTEGGPATNYTRFESTLNVNIGPKAVMGLQTAFCNRYNSTSGEAPTISFNPMDDFTLESAIQFDLATDTAGVAVHPNTWNGNKRPVFSAGAPISLSDPIGYRFPAGQSVTVRQGGVVASGSLIVVGHPSTAQYTGYKSTSGSSQVYGSSAMSLPSGGATPTFGFVPLGLFGIPSELHPAVMLWGDSIMYGQGDSSDSTTGFVGWAERAMISAASSYHMPFVNVSRSGSTTVDYSALYVSTCYALMPYVSHVICGISTNDISGGSTLATIQLNVQYAWQAARDAGCKVYHTTMTPKTTSTDSWATAANQTIVSGYGAAEIRGQFNAWLLTKVTDGTIDGVFDVNSAVEDSVNLGKWKTTGAANYATADGLHSSPAAHALMAAYAQPIVASFSV